MYQELSRFRYLVVIRSLPRARAECQTGEEEVCSSKSNDFISTCLRKTNHIPKAFSMSDILNYFIREVAALA